jgi:hypothetical protein
MSLSLKVKKSSAELAFSNFVYLNEEDAKTLDEQAPKKTFLPTTSYVEIQGWVWVYRFHFLFCFNFAYRPHADVKRGEIFVNSLQRMVARLSLDKNTNVQLFSTKRSEIFLSEMTIEVPFLLSFPSFIFALSSPSLQFISGRLSYEDDQTRRRQHQ